ncbi:MAG TPA: hypothetical protein VMG82_39610 [Candidatus Sulfotelmatobacter sp.]|nr:hypothetical protein [Candidatus Sulfotelmatobacter sp.]
MWGRPLASVNRVSWVILDDQAGKFKKEETADQNLRSDVVTQSANAGSITNRGIARSIFRWIHLIFSIPILGYIYSPFDRIPNYAPATRYVFVPLMVLSGLWMWKGHVVRRLMSKRSAAGTASLTNV